MSGHTPTQIKRLLERHGLRPDKSRGQHFLADPNLVSKVVRLADLGERDRVVEIGPGTGALTLEMARVAREVVAVEVDDRLAPLLRETVGTTARLLFADATDLSWVAELEGDGWKLVANLPYNVGTPLVLDVLRKVPEIATMVVMVQTEVADRLVAKAGEAAYGLPSVVVGLTALTGDRFTVPPQVFFPPPRVGSSVIRLDRKTVVGDVDEAIRLAAVAFGQRRKMLRASLAAESDDIAGLLRSVGIDPTARPETVSPQGFVDLAAALEDS